MPERILILGASGLVGGKVLCLLRDNGYVALGASRKKTGDQWVPFDLLDSATYTAALAGISTVMLISRPGDEDAAQHAAPFIDAMVAAGVKRVVDLSALGAAGRPDFSTRKVEALLETSGLQWTHVRPNFFMQMLTRPPLSTEIATSNTLHLPLGDAAIAYVDACDVAAVLYKALTDPTLVGRAMEVSGPEAVTHAEVARRISQYLGKTVCYIDIPEAAARELLLERGFPPPQVERVLRFYALCRQGFCASPDTAIADLLGRPLGRLDAVLKAHFAS